MKARRKNSIPVLMTILMYDSCILRHSGNRGAADEAVFLYLNCHKISSLSILYQQYHAYYFLKLLLYQNQSLKLKKVVTKQYKADSDSEPSRNVSLESIIGLLPSLKIKAGTGRQKVKLDTADILGSIHASSDTVEPEGRQMKQCSIKYLNLLCTFRHYTQIYILPYIYKATISQLKQYSRLQ